MRKEVMFVKVGNVVFPDHTTEPKVVISVTKYQYGTLEYFYLEMQELFGTDIVRRSYPGKNPISLLDPDEAERLYSLHKGGNPQPDPSKIDLTDYQKMFTLGGTICDGDILLDRDGEPYAVVTSVQRAQGFNMWAVNYKMFRTDIIDTAIVHSTHHIDIMRKRS